MAEFTNPLGNITRRNLAILTVILGLALVAGVWFGFAAPARQNLAATNALLNTATATNAIDRAAFQNAVQLGSGAGAQIYQKDSTLDGLLPTACSIQQAPGCFDPLAFPLSQIPPLVHSLGLILNSSPPGTAATLSGVPYYQYVIGITGTVPQIVSLVEALQATTSPMVTVAAVSATSTPSGITATISLDAWYSSDPGHLAAATQ